MSAAAGKAFHEYTPEDSRSYSQWAADHLRADVDSAEADGRQPRQVLARWREAAAEFEADAAGRRGLCSEPRHPYWPPHADADAEPEAEAEL